MAKRAKKDRRVIWSSKDGWREPPPSPPVTLSMWTGRQPEPEAETIDLTDRQVTPMPPGVNPAQFAEVLIRHGVHFRLCERRNANGTVTIVVQPGPMPTDVRCAVETEIANLKPEAI